MAACDAQDQILRRRVKSQWGFVVQLISGLVHPLPNDRGKEEVFKCGIEFKPVFAVRTIPIAFNVLPEQDFETFRADQIG